MLFRTLSVVNQPLPNTSDKQNGSEGVYIKGKHLYCFASLLTLLRSEWSKLNRVLAVLSAMGLLSRSQLLTPLHSECPKLHRVLAIPRAIGLLNRSQLLTLLHSEWPKLVGYWPF